MRLKTLAYTSRAKLDLTERDLSDVHLSARRCNALDGVTGLLVFDGIRFLQIIEGAEVAIDELVERLRRDQRHTALEVRDVRLMEARSFSGWSMELVRVSAGYKAARTELASILPENTALAVRQLAMRMSDEMSVSD